MLNFFGKYILLDFAYSIPPSKAKSPVILTFEGSFFMPYDSLKLLYYITLIFLAYNDACNRNAHERRRHGKLYEKKRNRTSHKKANLPNPNITEDDKNNLMEQVGFLS